MILLILWLPVLVVEFETLEQIERWMVEDEFWKQH